MKELRYKNVYLKHLGHVFSLHVAQHVDEPFETFVAGAYPEKVDLLAGHARVPDFFWGVEMLIRTDLAEFAVKTRL